MKRLPLGVKILVVILWAFGAWLAISATVYRLGPLHGDLMVSIASRQLWASCAWALLCVFIGFGLLHLKNWARLFIMIFPSAFLFCNLLMVTLLYITQPGRSIASALQIMLVNWLIWLSWSAMVVWYFLRPAVKAQFQRSPHT